MITQKIFLECLVASAMLAMTGGAAAQTSSTPMDYGDAPDKYGTTFGSDGARHADGSKVYLGKTAPDYEADGKPALNYGDLASFDDTDNSNDEDGVQYIGSFYDKDGTQSYGVPGTYYGGYWGKVIVTIHLDRTLLLNPNNFVYLDGWLDFGHNGAFGDQTGSFGGPNGTPWSELIVSDKIAFSEFQSDEQSFTYTFMNGQGPEGPFYSRFRVNYNEGANSPKGLMNTGEVEDVGGLGHGQVPLPEPSSNWLLFGALMALVSSKLLRRA